MGKDDPLGRMRSREDLLPAIPTGVSYGEDSGSIEETVRRLQEELGGDVVSRVSDLAKLRPDGFSTGHAGLDATLGVNGYPRGRIVEIFGTEGSGKTTLALHGVVSAQSEGKDAAFVDMEHSLDLLYAEQVGVQVSDLVFSQPDNGEQALHVVESMARCETVGVVVLDSVAALVTRAELSGRIGDDFSGEQARLMSQAMRRLATVASRHSTTILFLNQVRYKTGVLYGDPEFSPGGVALKHYASLRMHVRRLSTWEEAGSPVGIESLVRVVKNKLGPPTSETKIKIRHSVGVCSTE